MPSHKGKNKTQTKRRGAEEERPLSERERAWVNCQFFKFALILYNFPSVTDEAGLHSRTRLCFIIEAASALTLIVHRHTKTTEPTNCKGQHDRHQPRLQTTADPFEVELGYSSAMFSSL